jgi:hypothetical protein
MKKVAKVVLIVWSIFCLFGVVTGIANVADKARGIGEAEQGMAGVGAGCGMALWVGIWAAIALPALIIYLVTGKSGPTQVETGERVPKLCKECGKYYEGNPNFCPNCGKSIGR